MASKTLRKNVMGLPDRLSFLWTVALIITTFVTDTRAEILRGSVTSVQGKMVELNIGAEKGLRVGDSGRVYYNVKVEGKEQPIYVARFKVTRISERSSTAEIEEQTMDLRAGLLVEAAITLGELELTSEPPGARVSVDGKEMGLTPLVLPGIRLGQHLIRIAKEEHQPYEEQIDLTGPERKRVFASLRKLAGELLVSTDPPGASIYIDGSSVGTSPYEGKALSPGTSKVRIVNEGYETWERDVVVEAGKKIEVLAQLKAKEGSLEVQSVPSGAKVYLDGKEFGETPLALSGIRLGQHVIQVTREGYESHEEQVSVTEGEKKKILASLKKVGGDLFISTEPSGANVYVDGKSVGLSPYEGKTLSPGACRIRIVKEGYETWEKDVVIGVGKRIEVLAQLRAKEGGLEILSEPSGAKIYLDGKERGQTPFVLSSVQLGEHLVRVVKEGYEQYEERVSVTEGERKKVIVSLRRIVGGLSIRTEPSGARVYIDGKQVGTSPHEAKDLSLGAHNVRIEKEGYTPWEGIQTVIAGKRGEVPIELKARMGHLEVLSEPPGAKVFLDGKEMGQTPLSLPDLRAGRHQVRVTREGYETYDEEVRIIEGKNRVFASLKRVRGDLSINTEPPRSDIYINEKPVGASPYEGKDLLPGTYKVKVNKEGYETREMDVVIKAGESNKLRIELKEKRKEVAAMPPPAKPETKMKEAPKVMETQKVAEAPKAERGVDWTKGPCEAPVWKVGDNWRYKESSGKTWTNKVVEIKEDLYILEIGGSKDLFGYDRKTGNVDLLIDKSGRRSKNAGRFRKLFDFPILVGKKWSDSTTSTPTGGQKEVTYVSEFMIERVEEITTAAGRFKAFVIHCTQTNLRSHNRGWVRYWYSPEAKNWVKREYEKSDYWHNVSDAELISYKLSEAKSELPGEVDWTKGPCEAPVWKVGDKWTYRRADKVVWTQEIVEIKEDAFIMKIPGIENLIAYDKKTMNVNYSIGKNGRKFITSDDPFKRLFEFPLFVGKKWSYTTSRGGTNNCINEFRVEGVEEVRTPAGKFMAYTIYCKQKATGTPTGSAAMEGLARYWYSPEVKSWIRREFDKSGFWPSTLQDTELISFKLK